MHQRIVLKTFYLTIALWFCATAILRAQTPEPDLDSITEDSYQRMLARQALELELDTLATNRSEPFSTTLVSKKPERFYYLIGIFVVVGLAVVYWYIRRTSNAKDKLNK